MSVFCSLKDGAPLAIHEKCRKDSCEIKFAHQTSRSHDSPQNVSISCAGRTKSYKWKSKKGKKKRKQDINCATKFQDHAYSSLGLLLMSQEVMNNRNLRCNCQPAEPSLLPLLLDINLPVAKLLFLQRLQLSAWYINAAETEAVSYFGKWFAVAEKLIHAAFCYFCSRPLVHWRMDGTDHGMLLHCWSTIQESLIHLWPY